MQLYLCTVSRNNAKGQVCIRKSAVKGGPEGQKSGADQVRMRMRKCPMFVRSHFSLCSRPAEDGCEQRLWHFVSCLFDALLRQRKILPADMLDPSFLNDRKFLPALNKNRFTVQRKSEYTEPGEYLGKGRIYLQRKSENSQDCLSGKQVIVGGIRLIFQNSVGKTNWKRFIYISSPKRSWEMQI